MAQREFDITIGADGSVDVHIKGYPLSLPRADAEAVVVRVQ